MSKLLLKTQCSKCSASGRDRSGDNFALYDDGHGYCYAMPADGLSRELTGLPPTLSIIH
jgi:hypothetical protein